MFEARIHSADAAARTLKNWGEDDSVGTLYIMSSAKDAMKAQMDALMGSFRSVFVVGSLPSPACVSHTHWHLTVSRTHASALANAYSILRASRAAP